MEHLYWKEGYKDVNQFLVEIGKSVIDFTDCPFSIYNLQDMDV